MDKQEAYQILTLLQANYPDSFRGMSKEAANVKVNLWADMFSEEPFEAVAAAAKAYIAFREEVRAWTSLTWSPGLLPSFH